MKLPIWLWVVAPLPTLYLAVWLIMIDLICQSCRTVYRGGQKVCSSGRKALEIGGAILLAPFVFSLFRD